MSHRLTGPAVFLLTVAVTLGSVLTHPQLGFLGGLTDEYFPLGAKLRVTGTLGPSRDDPSTMRAPGYPAFVAAVLLLAAPDPARADAEAFARAGALAVMLAQALIQALAALALFAWLSRRVDPWLAAGAALAYGVGAYPVVLVGVLHYGLLHMAAMIAGCWALDRALSGRWSAGRWVAAGLVWGLATLLRPVTLPLPLFLLAALLFRRAEPARRALLASVLVAAGMVVPLAPWTVRNWRVTGRVVPVNENNWATVWGQTARPLTRDPNRYVWFDLYREDFLPIFARATGAHAYDYLVHVRHMAEVERAFRAAALANLRQHPGTYAGNVARSAVSLVVDPNPVLLAAFRAVRGSAPARPGPPGVVDVPQSWFVAGEAQPRLPAALLVASDAWVIVLLLLGALGVGVTLRRRDGPGLTPLVVGACVLFTHAVAFTHLMHYYLRWPLLAALAAVGLDAVARRGRTPRIAALALAAFSLAVTLAVLS